MQTPKQIIEKIRKKRFGIGLDLEKLPEDHRAFFEDKEKFIGDAARLASALHSEKPHFILELIQNAEDNDYDVNIKPKLRFIIQEDKLILQNNEKGFKDCNVDAICGIGGSTKRDKKSMGYIGEKGIGFKSVFMITNEPQIYSNGFHFKFDYDETDPKSIIIPHWVDDVPDFIDSEQTNIVLPLKNEVKEELTEFTKIDPCILLFLRKLKYIEIEDKIRNITRTIERYDIDGKIKIVHSDGENYWKIIKSEILTIPLQIKEEKRKDITETQIILAFPLKQDGGADTSNEQNVFAFLPVRSYGFRFIIQADFILPPSREDIYKDQSEYSWNRFLRDNIASVFLKAVEEFKLDENLKKTYYNFIPLISEIKDTFFSHVVEQIHNALRRTQCILTESENWLEPQKVFRADDDIRSLIPNDDLKYFFDDKEYISTHIRAKRDILDVLKIPQFGLDELLQCLEREEWLKQQNDDWFIRLYFYLSSKHFGEEQIKKLKILKIVRLESDELTSIKDGPVFTPLDKKGDYGFEKELRIIKRTFFEIQEKEKGDVIKDFLKKIGIQNASPYEIIENHILPIYENGDWKNKSTDQLLGYIRYIKDNLENYEKAKKDDPLWRLKKLLYIRINKTVDDTNCYEHPQNVYFPKTFGNQNNLESLFEGIENISFVHREYIDEIIKKYRQAKRKGKKSKADIQKKREAEIKRWRDFFVKLGTNDGLKVEETDKSYLTWEDKRNLRNDGNYTYEKLTDYKLIPLQEILERIDVKKAKILANLLNKSFDKLSQYKELEYEWRYYSWYIKKVDSSWLHLLKTSPWLPTSKGTLARPSEVFLNKPEIKELLGDNVLYLSIEINNEILIKDLGINTEANVNGIIENLKRLTKQKCNDKTVFTKLYDFLNKKYENYKDIINNAFSSSRIIYIPDTTQIYFSSKEVLWKDVRDIFGENRGYLEKYYPQLKSFFVEKVGVSEKPIPKDYADVLLDLTKKENLCEKDKDIILKIYRELNNYLNPENNEHRISEEDWWNKFIKEPIFWTDKGEFWKNDNDVFVNDNDKLYELFKDKSTVAFLKLPDNYYPQIQYFIEASGISYLSKAVNIEPTFEDNPQIEQNLTKIIQQFVPFILRYLYQLLYNDYEKLKKNGVFNQLINLKCYSVESLKVMYKLGCESEIDKRSSLLYNGNLYIQKKQLENTDSIAIELAKLFGNIIGLDDFIISIFKKKNNERIESYLKAKGIQELPEEEKKWFKKEGEVIVEEENIKSLDENVTQSHISESTVKTTQSKSIEPSEVGIININKEDNNRTWEPVVNPEGVQPRIEKLSAIDKDTIETESPLPITQEREQKDVEVIHDITKKENQAINQYPNLKETNLSQEDKKAIGFWGEKYAFGCLRKELIGKYSDGKIEESYNGFNIRINDELVVEVRWLNAISDIGKGYDIEVIEKNVKKYIEVKSTKTNTIDWFDVSEKQWELMKTEGDNFHIYRVFDAGTEEAKIIDIPNPYKMWREGYFDAYPIRIKL